MTVNLLTQSKGFFIYRGHILEEERSQGPHTGFILTRCHFNNENTSFREAV